MTEAEWLASDDPRAKLEFLRDKASERKLRLFACACCRRIDRLIIDPRGRDALAFAERHVEVGVVRRKGRPAIKRAVHRAWVEAYNKMFLFEDGNERAKCLISSNAVNAAGATIDTDPTFSAQYAAAFSSFAVAWEAQVASGANPYPDLQDSFKQPEQNQQAHLLRDVFGNPFCSASIAPPILVWDDGTVLKLAQAIYEEEAFDRLNILADALEEAGCADATILEHLRGPGPHIRGCWPVDLILGKS
jgi:hypothetical protein